MSFILQIANIGYITIISFFSALIISKIFDKVIGEFDITKELKRPLYESTLILISIMWINGLFIYLFSKIIKSKSFPSPFDYDVITDYRKISEGTLIFTYILLHIQSTLRTRLVYIYNMF
jgi:hypothetical protein